MYLGNDKSYTYYVGSGQRHSAGNFLILMSERGKPFELYNVRAVVRKVALRQLGLFMMGFARIAGKTYSISGAYGHDGLTLYVEPEAFALGVPVPRELMDAWDNGGGWNSAGSEAPNMRQWAIDNLEKLTPKK
jgi:hypothetical protein